VRGGREDDAIADCCGLFIAIIVVVDTKCCSDMTFEGGGRFDPAPTLDTLWV
jgi:hypothetical protein